MKDNLIELKENKYTPIIEYADKFYKQPSLNLE